MQRLARAALVAALLPMLGACSMALSEQTQREMATAPELSRAGRVLTAERARGIDGRVGWGRATIFYIPVAPVTIEGDGNERVMATVREALALAGYEPEVGPPSIGSEPIVTCDVQEFSFTNFTWLWPFVRTWGDVSLNVAVKRSGVPVWERDFSGEGSVVGAGNGFGDAGNEALAATMSQMAAAFTEESFYRAVTDTTPLATSATIAPTDPEPEPQPAAPTTSSCSTDQVLSMKSSGLNDDQIRRACGD